MKDAFYIVLNIKTAMGFEGYGRFFIGNERDVANAVFDQLQGNGEMIEESILHLDLVEIRNDLPVNIQMISCTLEQLAENCRIITKEIFRIFSLEKL